MSSLVHISGTYTATSAASSTPSLDPATSSYYHRHPILHHSYGSPPEISQSYYVASWSESPGSSGRSVSPCDEYQPPDYTCGGSTSLQDLTIHHQTSQLHQPVQPYTRVTKRRTTANKKERRRTQSINNAFADLRDCIPNVPSDTKLSKIKTLRLATSYIAYLMGVLADEEASAGSFRADLLPHHNKRTTQNLHHHQTTRQQTLQEEQQAMENARRCSELTALTVAAERKKGRTGWPQHVWALELKP